MRTLLPRFALALAALVSLAACADPAAAPAPAAPTATTTAPGAAELDLPIAAHVEALDAAAPVIVVDGDRVMLDGAVVGSASAIVKLGRLQKVDALFERLQGKREAWKVAHGNAPFPGAALLRMQRATPGLVVKSVLQTTAFARYPNLAFAVARDGGDGAPARVAIEPVIPAEPRAGAPAPPVEKRLFVLLDPGKSVVLQWRAMGGPPLVVDGVEAQPLDAARGGVLVSEIVVPWAEAFARGGDGVRAPALAARFTREWAAQGEHKDPRDTKIDRARLEVADATELGDLVAVLDALYAPTRDLGSTKGRAFVVELSPHPFAPEQAAGSGTAPFGSHTPRATLKQGAIDVKGKLPPEVVQRIVRQSFGRLRACYEDGRERNPKLAGNVVVHFTIAKDGASTGARDKGSKLEDAHVKECIVRAFGGLSFPAPEGGGAVSVDYSISFAPPEPAAPTP